MPGKRQKSQYQVLRKKWLVRHKQAKAALHQKHKEALEFVSDILPDKEKIAPAAVGLAMLASSLPASNALAAATNQVIRPKEEAVAEIAPIDKKQALLDELKSALPQQVRPLTVDEEGKLDEILSRTFGMEVRHEINGLRLNRTYGVIGAEQHLMRYPGDTMATHLSPSEVANKMIYSSGMAPGRGAWGYFTRAGQNMTQKDVERERWYIAVQTFLAPEYNTRLSDYRGFFKFRKMLLVNPKAGQAIVTVIGDAGPAEWTGKHLGGSPEVMYHLGLGSGSRKGGVLYFFIDDPSDTIPLGPVKL
ncbi:hypothetical protein HY382_02975 [Candidatus Curtissbacteria bacterium]|nr:hypothetical protein [Candidatus Curtissbacteria bacterium]